MYERLGLSGFRSERSEGERFLGCNRRYERFLVKHVTVC